MITKQDVDDLEKQYLLALDALNKVEYVTFYPKYPKEINLFMDTLIKPPWVAANYQPSEISNIMNSIENANLLQIKWVFTGVNRAERFCDGAWISTLKNRQLDAVFKRLKQIVDA